MTDGSPALGFLAALLRQRRLVVVLPIVFGVLALGLSLLSRSYVAESKFLPQSSEENLSRLAGLATQFGLPLGLTSNNQGQSPDFYATLIKSREVLLQAALTPYHVPVGAALRDTLSGTLVDFLHIRGGAAEDVDKAAVRALDQRAFVSVDPRAGVVQLETVAPYGALAEQVNRRLLQLVQQFNQSKRQSMATAERVFTEQRLAVARSALDSAEDALSRFIQKNRIYQDSPELVLEYNRLQRRVDLRQQVFVTLSQAYEQARLAEVRDTPLITVVEPPEDSAEPRVRVKLNAALGILFGLFLGIGVALLRDYAARQRRQHPGEYQEVEELVRHAVKGLWPRRRVARRA